MTDPTIEERIEKLRVDAGEKRRAAMEQWESEALAIIDELLVVNRECQERCICQCLMSEHENYGEDGFSCGEGHECLLASTAVCVAVAEQRREIERLREKVETQENALMEMGEYD